MANSDTWSESEMDLDDDESDGAREGLCNACYQKLTSDEKNHYAECISNASRCGEYEGSINAAGRAHG